MSTVVDHLVGAAGLIEALALAWEAKGAGEFVSLSKAEHLKEVVSNGFSGRVLLSKVTRQWNCAFHCCYSSSWTQRSFCYHECRPSAFLCHVRVRTWDPWLLDIFVHEVRLTPPPCVSP